MIIPPRTLVIPAAALAVFLFLGSARGHDIFTDWKQPGTDKSCCSGGPTNGDCYPTQARLKDGRWFAFRREDSKWIAVPDTAMLPPIDTNAYLCAPAPPAENDPATIYCFRPPFMGT